MSGPRSDPDDPSHPMYPNPLRLCGRSSQGWHLRRRGVRMRRDRADQPDRVRNRSGYSRNAPNFLFNCLGTQALPEVVHQKNTSDRKPPPESSSRTEQIREHRRHRCQSALGLRSWLVARPSIHPGRATLESACWSGVAVAGHPARSRCVWSRRIRRRRRPPP